MCRKPIFALKKAYQAKATLERWNYASRLIVRLFLQLAKKGFGQLVLVPIFLVGIILLFLMLHKLPGNNASCRYWDDQPLTSLQAKSARPVLST